MKPTCKSANNCIVLNCLRVRNWTKLQKKLENNAKVKNTDKKLDFGMFEVSLKKFSVSDNETSNIFLQYWLRFVEYWIKDFRQPYLPRGFNRGNIKRGKHNKDETSNFGNRRFQFL